MLGIRPLASRRRGPACENQSSSAKRAGDPEDQQDHERLDVAELVLLQPEHQQHVGRRQAHAPRSSAARTAGSARSPTPITSARSQAAIAISHSTHRTSVVAARVAVAAGLRQVAAAGDPEPRRQRLQQDRHQVRQQDDAEQRVAVLRAAGEVGRPVPRIHVADGHQVARAREREQLAPEARRWAPGPTRGPPED